MDIVRPAETETPNVSLRQGVTPALSPIDTGEEVPFSDYARAHHHPYTVDYFKLGDNWEVFTDEINTIEPYVQDKIESGEIANSVAAVRKELRELEKINNVKDEERAVVRVGILAEYIHFLQKCGGIRRDFAKYGTK